MEKEEKRQECFRLMENTYKGLLVKLEEKGIKLSAADKDDFCSLMKVVRDNLSVIEDSMFVKLTSQDLRLCIRIRHVIAHQKTIGFGFLNEAIDTLKKCQAAFGITSPVVPLRIMSCRRCGAEITRTAQPTVSFRDCGGNKQLITRAYDVHPWTVANMRGEMASRENTWYHGWVWTYTFCATCHSAGKLNRIGFRFDWAPEDRVDLRKDKVYYDNDKATMVVEDSEGKVHDLTHVVSDGVLRRHRYALFEKALVAADATKIEDPVTAAERLRKELNEVLN
jgi:hypothetical protein